MGSQPPIELATLGMWDTLLLMVLALVVFGPRRLPKIGRQLGKLMYEFRKASNDFKFQMEEELRNAEEAERRQKEEEERKRALAAAPPRPQLEQTTAQAPESSAAPPESEAPTPASTESPYPGQTPYADLAAEATRPEETAPVPSEAVTPSAAEDTALRIQPPSTGETVAAERPGRAPESVNSEAGPEAERSEPAAHHG